MKYDLVHTYLGLNEVGTDLVVRIALHAGLDVEHLGHRILEELENPGGGSGTTIGIAVTLTEGEEVGPTQSLAILALYDGYVVQKATILGWDGMFCDEPVNVRIDGAAEVIKSYIDDVETEGDQKIYLLRRA